MTQYYAPINFPHDKIAWLKSIRSGTDCRTAKVLSFNETGAYVKLFDPGYTNRAGEVTSGITTHAVVRFDASVKCRDINENADYLVEGRLSKADKDNIENLYSLDCPFESKVELVEF